MYGDTLYPAFSLDSPIVVTEDEIKAAKAYVARRCPSPWMAEVLEALGLEDA